MRRTVAPVGPRKPPNGACRQRGMDRTGFYEWKRRLQTQDFEGLKDLPPIHKSHPQTTPPETVEKSRSLALSIRPSAATATRRC